MSIQREVRSAGDEGGDSVHSAGAMPRNIGAFKVAAALCLLVGGVLSVALPFSFLIPERFWDANAIAPSGVTRGAAATALVPAVIISVTAFHQWTANTADGFASTQKIALWSGAVGALLIFSGWTQLTRDAQEGFVGSIFLLLFAGGGVLLEPVVRWSKAKEDRERQVESQRVLREAVEEALAQSRSGIEAPAQGEVRRGGWWRRLSRRRSCR